jgi:hypothetical protein
VQKPGFELDLSPPDYPEAKERFRKFCRTLLPKLSAIDSFNNPDGPSFRVMTLRALRDWFVK